MDGRRAVVTRDTKSDGTQCFVGANTRRMTALLPAAQAGNGGHLSECMHTQAAAS